MPLPPEVAPAKILPPDWRDHLGTGEGLPAVSLDQEGKILVSEIADKFDVVISAEYMVPENFNSAQALWDLIQKLEDEE